MVMEDYKLISWLSETVPCDSDDSDSSSWTDISSIELSEEEDEDDDDKLFFPMMQSSIRKRRKRTDDYFHIIESWSEPEFKNHLRISKRTANKLIDELQKSGYIASHNFGLKPLQPKLCFYIFLSFLASTEPLTPIACRFDISVSSTYRVIKRVLSWILTKLDDIIKWPYDFNECKSICDAFYSKTKIVNCLGVIDCTQIKIIKPKQSREYCNSKGYYSINLQTTVDSNMRFTSIYCGEPGSSNSARVLQRSPLYQKAMRNNELFPVSTFLVGHSGYPTLPWLLSPFRENKRLSPEQKDFNVLHANTKKICDKTYNVLKGRFRRLKHFTAYRNISFIIDSVVAACILHNYCLLENDHLDE